MRKILMAVLMFCILSITACTSDNNKEEQTATENKTENPISKEEKTFANKNYVDYVDTDDIIKDKSKLGDDYNKYYAKYIDYIAPNGKAIKLVAADKVTDEQLLKAYNVLSFYLTNTTDYDKTAIANSMADRGAVLNLPNGADGDGNTPDEALMGQPLYQMELPVAGSKWYQENDYEHRDASYEEIFHMVHDYGIGTTQNPAAMPELSQKIKDGMDIALPKNKAHWGKKGIWGLGSGNWMKELAKEASLEQEYIVGGIDSFFGLWEAYTESDKGMWGMYVPKNRADVKTIDKPAYDIITSFIGENLTYMERIAPEFDGKFKLYLDKDEPYTFKSQYIQNARLTGKNNSSILANELDNILIGNSGNNTLDGANGNDVVQFTGSSDEYTISNIDEKTIVKDSKNRDGEDTLLNVEILRFTDKDINSSEL